MSKFLKCDAVGCDATEQVQIGFDGKQIKRVNVAISWPAPAETEVRAYELCEACRDRLLHLSDPKIWKMQSKAAA